MKILITNHHLINFAGSEINVFQLCSALNEMGIIADVFTFSYGYPINKLYKNKRINVYSLSNEKILPQSDYDIIWAHHAPTLDYLIFQNNLPNAKVIFSSLGPYEPLEAPPYYHDELSCILSISNENKMQLINNGVKEDKIKLFPNYAPKKFFDDFKTDINNEPLKIVIVSNHPPKELRNFASLAKTRKHQVTFLGIQDRQEYVDQNILKSFDLVITIGKTVQYCFALKIPVYCYDYFGGPGFVDKHNIKQAENYNFSGRGFNRKLEAEQLLEDITNGFPLARDNLDFLFKYSRSKFCLEDNLTKILDIVRENEIIDFKKIRNKYSLAGRANLAYMNQIYLIPKLEISKIEREQTIETLITQAAEREQTIETLITQAAEREQTIQALITQVAERDTELVAFALSKSWRITRPLRKIKNIIKGKKNA